MGSVPDGRRILKRSMKKNVVTSGQVEAVYGTNLNLFRSEFFEVRDCNRQKWKAESQAGPLKRWAITV